MGLDEVATREESLPALLEQFNDVFDWPDELSSRREIEHHIHLKKDANLVNVRPYKYG